MNPKNLPKQIRKDLKIVSDLLNSDRPCNAIWLQAAAGLLETVAEQIRTALGPDTGKPQESKAETEPRFLADRAICEAAGV